MTQALMQCQAIVDLLTVHQKQDQAMTMVDCQEQIRSVVEDI